MLRPSLCKTEPSLIPKDDRSRPSTGQIKLLERSIGLNSLDLGVGFARGDSVPKIKLLVFLFIYAAWGGGICVKVSCKICAWTVCVFVECVRCDH